MERTYAPYSKWFGTAFNHLACAQELGPIFMQVLQAQDWKARQEFLAQAYETAARRHNCLGITSPLKEKAAQYHGRPYLVAPDGGFVKELRRALTSEEVKNFQSNLGSLNQFVDSNEQLENLELCKKLKELYT